VESWKVGMGGKSEWFDRWKGWMIAKLESQTGWEVRLVGHLEWLDGSQWLDSRKVGMVQKFKSCNGWTGQIAG
jgi:hypothetical protein